MLNLEKVRNIGIIAHIDAGKTTTTERILYLSGRIRKMGNVDDGNTTTDYIDQERERGITIVSAAITFDWKDYTMNLIDTPGHVDFTAEVERSLRVLDGVAIVICGVAGVQPQTETVWRQANRYGVPRIVYINKMDRVGSNLENAVGKIRERLGAVPAVLQIPIGSEENFMGVVDVISERAFIWREVTDGNNMEEIPVPEELVEDVKLAKLRLIEVVAESDEEALSIFAEKEHLTNDELKRYIRSSTIRCSIVPVLCGSSFRFKGTQLLLDAVTDYLPSPLERPAVVGHHPKTGDEIVCHPSYDDPTSALVFKVVTDPYLGTLSFVRVYSGKLKSNSYIYNSTLGKRERIMRCIHLQADKKEDVEELQAGDIGGVLGFKESATGHTLCDEIAPVLLESVSFPEPVISMSVEPMTKADEDKLNNALRKYSIEDPTFKVHTDTDSGQIIIKGMGELHLEVMVERIKREQGLTIRVGKPQVSYRETIGKEVTVRGQYIRQTGGKGQYGDVLLRVAPGGKNSGLIFDSQVNENQIPTKYISFIEKGCKDGMEVGIMLGFPVVDLSVTVLDGSYHEVDSSEISFRVAASQALKEALRKGNPQLLEPIMSLQVITPEEYLGDALAILSKRRCKIDSMDRQGLSQVVEAFAPLADMFGFTTELRSVTQGRSSHTMEFSHMELAPQNVRDAVVLAVRGMPWTA
jgi:elongation factor G